MSIIPFKIAPEEPLNIVFDRLFKALDLSNLDFMVNKKHEELVGPPFQVDSVTMSGKPEYVRQNLKVLRESLFKHISEYADSDESIDSKIQMLGSVQISVTDKLLHWEISFPELYDGPLYFELLDQELKPRQVSINDLIISGELKNEIIEHHNVRLAFFQLINKYIEIQLLKLKHNNIPIIEENNIKELELTELWMGLEIMGCFSGLNNNEKALLRKNLYQLLGVADCNYNDKHNQIKRREAPKFTFLKRMIKDLNNKFK